MTHSCGAMVPWLEHRTLNRENLGLNRVNGGFLVCFRSLRSIIEYLELKYFGRQGRVSETLGVTIRNFKCLI